MKDFVGNPAAIQYLREAIVTKNLSHAYLFCGPGNVGKTKAGIGFAKMLLCTDENPINCNGCASCKLMEKGNHPDFFFIDKDTVAVDEVRELVASLELKTYLGVGKVALISHAENMTTSALNSLLKTLEEPDAKTTIILTAENPKNLLPTIVSRARMINFCLATDRQVYEHLNVDTGVVRAEATLITELATGRIGFATTLAENNEVASGIAILSKDFNRIYKSSDIYEKINFADKLSKDKESLPGNLDNLELAARASLMKEELLGINKERVSGFVGMIDGISKCRESLASNANAKLAIESLLFRSTV